VISWMIGASRYSELHDALNWTPTLASRPALDVPKSRQGRALTISDKRP